MYEWVKALHVISVIAWMAGLFYLPRLYVYHTQVPVGSPQSELFKVMERRLLRAIMNPAMIGSWVFGLWTAYNYDVWMQPWFHAKFALVLIMSGAHHALARRRKEFAEDRNTHSERYYRIVNEVPTLLMIAIVILVIVKPF